MQFLELVSHPESVTVAGAHYMVAGKDNAVLKMVLGDFLDRRVRSRLAVLGR